MIEPRLRTAAGDDRGDEMTTILGEVAGLPWMASTVVGEL